MSSRSATDCEDSERSEASGESSEEEHYRSSAEEEEQSDGKENNKDRKETNKSVIHQPSFIKKKKQHRRTVLRNKIRSAEQHPLKKNAKNRAPRQTRLRTVPSKSYEDKFDDGKPVRRTVHIPPGAKRATIIVKQAGTADRVLDLYSQKRCQILGA